MLSIPRLHSFAKSGIVQGKKCLTVVLGLKMTGKRGCCDFIIVNNDRTVAMVGRTLEFSSGMGGHPQIQVFKKGQKNKVNNHTKKVSLSKYGYMAVLEHYDVDGNTRVTLPALDGMNEMGLSCDALYFSKECCYPLRDMNNVGPSFWYGDMVSLVLGNCATLDEVKKLLTSHEIFGDPNPIFDTLPENISSITSLLPLHFQVFDADGNGLVIESTLDPEHPEQTKLKIHESCGVMTNSPSYDWHLKNRSQYANLSNEMQLPRNDMHKLDPASPAPWGNGASWLGMPGDYTPGSRFIRVAAHKYYVEKNMEKLKGEKDGIIAVSHILNSQDLTHGLILEEDGTYDYTQWVNIKDLKSKKMHFRPYGELNWQDFDLTETLASMEDEESVILHPIDTNIQIQGEC